MSLSEKRQDRQNPKSNLMHIVCHHQANQAQQHLVLAVYLALLDVFVCRLITMRPSHQANTRPGSVVAVGVME